MISTLANTLLKVKEGLLSVVFPVYCASCGKEGELCCADCQAILPRTAFLACPVCSARNPAGRTCERCKSKTALSGLIAASSYADPAVRNLIKALKFDSSMEAAALLKRACVHARGVAHAVLDNFSVQPTPLHKRRERMRGYNQAEIIADTFFPGLKINALRRVRWGTPQTELQDEERRENLKGAFTALKDIKGKNILLIDDVFTTGATMEAAARALRMAGAEDVWGFVVARG